MGDMKKRIFSILFSALIAATPLTGHAYLTTSQRAIEIDETTALFFITYEFGNTTKDFYLPVLAVRDQEHGSEVKSVGFSVFEDGEEATDVGATQAIVLADAPLANGMYRVPAGTANRFTLAVILTTDEDTPETDYTVAMTDLPFYSGDELTYMHLNPSELQYYRTPEVELNSNDTVSDLLGSISVEVTDITYAASK